MERPRMRFKIRRTIAWVAVAGVTISGVVALVALFSEDAFVGGEPAGDALSKALLRIPHEWMMETIRRIPGGYWPDYSFLEWWCFGILTTAAACAVLAFAGAIREGRLRRITMRQWMGVVAVAGVLSSGANLWHRSRRFERRALDHQKERETIILSDLEMYLILTEAQFGQSDPDEPREVREAAYKAFVERGRKFRAHFEPLTKYVLYHEEMSSKYERASVHPWFPVAPDPPAPPRPSLRFQKELLARLASLIETDSTESKPPDPAAGGPQVAGAEPTQDSKTQ